MSMRGHGPIMILTASAGAGHLMAARAMESTLHALAPNEDIELYDMIEHGGYALRRIYAEGYRDLVRCFPSAWGWLYYGTDRPNERLSERFWDRLRRVLQDISVRRFVQHLIRRRPRLVINTHFLPPEIVARLRRQGRLDCIQATAITDFETHRLWVQQPTERYYTATKRARDYAIACGADRDSIRVTGIPVRPEFEMPADRNSLRRHLNIDPNRPVVLLLVAAGGVVPTERFLQELISMPVAAQIVAITGGHQKLRRRLQRLAQTTSRPVKVLGFTARMDAWMRAADLVITKPGGLTVAEALVCRVPIVIVNPLAGQELCNNDYLLERQAAVKVNKFPLLGQRVSCLLNNPQRLEAMRNAAARIAQPGAAARIARDALELLSADSDLTNAKRLKESRTEPHMLSPTR